MFKRFFLFSLFVLTLVLFGCNQPLSEDEEITAVGLEQATIYLGTNFDFMEGVVFTSTTRGDITDSVEILEDIDTNTLGVSMITYRTHYENNQEFRSERRVVVLYPPLNASNNMILSGDFSQNMSNWQLSAHASYPSNVNYILDPDLIRLQVIINSVSLDSSWPFMAYLPLTFDATKTYTFSILVSGTNNTFFRVDIVDLDHFNAVTAIIMEAKTIDVAIQGQAMQLQTFTFTPLVSSTNGRVRFMFGGNETETPQGIIYIDNIKLTVND